MTVRETDQSEAAGLSVGARLARDQGWLPGKSQSCARRAPTVSSVYRTGRHGQTGVTLIELIITIVITSVAVAGVVGAFSLVTGRSADPLVQSRATALGQLYLDEIMARYYNPDTPVGGVPREDGCVIESGDPEDRDQFFSVDQYDGLEDEPQFVASEFGETYSGFSVRVEVSCAGDEVNLPPDDAKRIDVIVEDTRGRETTISAYRGNY